jgi:hypothetical protein
MGDGVRDGVQVVPHQVNRLAVATGASFDEFRVRYEEAVPRLDVARFDRLIRDSADWDTVLQETAENAPHRFIIYWSGDYNRLLELAGGHRRAVEYLMGNHTIAQRMYRYDPAIMLYAPLRTLIYESAQGDAWFAVEQPSTHFGSFGNPDIAGVGRELDHELAALLEHLDIPVPDALTEAPR